MILWATKTFVGSLFLVSVISAFALSRCSVDTIIVKGRVDHVPRDAKVRVQLVYPKEQIGESGEVTIVDGTFSIPIEFLTQSRRPVVNGWFEKCDRKPKTVVVRLVVRGHNDDADGDRVSLDLARDFKMADTSAYVLKSELVLDGLR